MRMENILAICGLVVVAMMLSGFLPSRYDSNQPHTTTRERYVVQAGDTFWSVGEAHYDSDKEIRSFDEFMHDFRVQNGFEVGSGRKFLHVGETLNIERKHKI